MKIFVTGTRGIPDIAGGVEKHCQELYPLIAANGHHVIIATRKPYVTKQSEQWQGVRLEHIDAPHLKSFEAIVHTFLAVINAFFQKPDILHIHAIGPGLMVPFARLLGLKVVVTNHGPDYDRQKWGWIARRILRLGEYLSGRFANEVIVISGVIRNIIAQRCHRKANLIYNGVVQPKISINFDFLEKKGVRQKKYILAVSRFVPEKGLHDLINAFQQLKTNWQLVIAGDADHETDYSNILKKQIAETANVVHTGYIMGENLNQLYSHAGLFVLPSHHEGLPIALLEAMSYGLPVLISDIPANKEVNLSEERYFKCGDVKDLTKKLSVLMKQTLSDTQKNNMRITILEKYNWTMIADQTVAVYEKALGKSDTPI